MGWIQAAAFRDGARRASLGDTGRRAIYSGGAVGEQVQCGDEIEGRSLASLAVELHHVALPEHEGVRAAFASGGVLHGQLEAVDGVVHVMSSTFGQRPFVDLPFRVGQEGSQDIAVVAGVPRGGDLDRPVTLGPCRLGQDCLEARGAVDGDVGQPAVGQHVGLHLVPSFQRCDKSR